MEPTNNSLKMEATTSSKLNSNLESEINMLCKEDMIEKFECESNPPPAALSLSLPATLPNGFSQQICECCLKKLNLTKEFFDEIIKGQKLLAHITKNVVQEADQGKGELDGTLASQIVKRRKRGRPKKTTSSTGPEVNSKEEKALVNEEPRMKRSTRPPSRYCSEAFESHEAIEDQQKDATNEIVGIKQVPAEILVPDEDTKTEEGNLPTSNENDDDSASVKSEVDRTVKLSDLVRGRLFNKRRKRGRPKSKKKCVDFRCEVCGKEYCSQSALVYHKLSAHDTNRDFLCTICKKAFSHKGLLTNHMFTHYSEKNFACDEPGCVSSYKSKASLYTHKRSVHLHNKNKEFTCEKCGGQFTLKSSLKSHMRLHSGEKPFMCKYCGKSFNHRGNMKEHLRTHTKEKPYVCDGQECEKRFATFSQLKIHKLTHTGSKPYLCIVCGKGFTYPDNLRCHMKRHSGEKAEECPICHKQFTDACSLKKHKRIHTGEKPYECSICNKAFSDPSNFAKHKKIHPPTTIQTVSDTVSVQSVIVTTDNIQSTSVPTAHLPDSVGIVSGINDEACAKDSVESVQVSGCETFVQILTPEAFAALSDGTSVTDTNVIYLYQPSDIFSVAIEEPSIEVTAGECETVTIQEVIETTLTSQDVITFSTDSDIRNPETLIPSSDVDATNIGETVIT